MRTTKGMCYVFTTRKTETLPSQNNQEGVYVSTLAQASLYLPTRKLGDRPHDTETVSRVARVSENSAGISL